MSVSLKLIWFSAPLVVGCDGPGLGAWSYLCLSDSDCLGNYSCESGLCVVGSGSGTADVNVSDVVSDITDTNVLDVMSDTSSSGDAYVRIEAGTFTMGSPNSEEGRNPDETQHEVTITRDFWLKKTEVTQGEWESVMGSNPSRSLACGSDCPVEGVSWLDTVEYLNTLSDREGLERCYGIDASFSGLGCTGYRLPTEAEWEYAARAGTTEARYGELESVAWYVENSNDPHGVGQKSPNPWGLHDMLGNVWEWVQDWYAPYGGNASDPLGLGAGGDRVARGGSWHAHAGNVRAAYRGTFSPGYRGGHLGFRSARSIP